YSETQGRMQNGFWFDNPPWYEPIDLNKAFGTTNQPVAHFYSFAVGTNVFLNELRTSNNGATQRSQQFIEFLGPLPPGNKPQIKGWTITHAARGNSGYPILGEDMYTNTIAGTAVFREASNATTNKGWGFYVLGNAAVPNVDEELFPEEDSTYMYYRGALVVRRSMGAYAQRVCWTSGSQRDVQDFIDMGYTYLGALSGSSSRKPTYAWVPDPAAEDENSHDMVWSSAYYADSAITPGGFNLGQEDALWDILNEEEEKIPPLVSQPVVTRFEFADAADVEGLALPATWEKVALLSFAVQTTNGVALAKGDYSWYLESTTALPFPAGGSGTEIGGESAPADKDVEAEAGTEVEVTFAISVDDMDVIDTRFYRIKAYPKGE
ncbi:MAG: hypothetical protein IJV65_05515, partial [Kiritimatiellae bacterium]|nr:hypothetical protein [Kiritimatiellia bacterium]